MMNEGSITLSAIDDFARAMRAFGVSVDEVSRNFAAAARRVARLLERELPAARRPADPRRGWMARDSQRNLVATTSSFDVPRHYRRIEGRRTVARWRRTR